MPFATIPNSRYLDLFGYRITNQPTVETAYNLNPADVGNPTYGLNVALVLPRANQPTFLAEDWATRQQTISQYNSTNSLWSTFGADKQQFDSVTQQIRDLGLKVIESTDTGSGNYVTSADSRTIWVKLDSVSDFHKLFSDQAQPQQWTNPDDSNVSMLFWNGSLALRTEWNVSGLWFDLDQNAPRASNLVPGVGEATLVQGPQGIGNAAPQARPPGPLAVPPQTIAQGYDFPLNGPAVKTGTIALIEPGVGAALPTEQTLSFQQLLNQYLASLGLTGNGQVYTQGANGQVYSGDAGERSLDVGTIAGVNPNSNIGLYVGSGDRGWAQSTTFTAFQSAIWDTVNNPAVMSSSWNDSQSMTPNSPFYEANWQLIVDAALRNQTVVHDAYDGGSGNETGNGLTNVFYNGMSPYGIVVGGTSISSLTNALNDPTLSTQFIQPALAGNPAAIWQLVAGGLTSLPTNAADEATFVETVWNQYYVQGTSIAGYYSGQVVLPPRGYSQNWATSGGVDVTQGVPSYQSAYGLTPVTSDPQAAPGRGVPDVAALSQGNLYYLLPNSDMVGAGPDGGTSAAAPFWATLVSQLDFIFADQGLPQLGYMNDLLYVASAIAPASFNDITLGNNISSFVRGQGTYQSDGTVMPTGFGYYAGPGYDLVTGLGSPNGTLLARALTAIAHEQMYFDAVPDVLNPTGFGGWMSGANQSLSLQAMAGTGVTLGLNLGATSIGVSTGPSAAFAWTSRFAEQVLQPDVDQALVRLFDGQSQAFATQTNVGVGQDVSVTINGGIAVAAQASLTADFGFADYMTGQGVVRMAQAVMVAETAGGLDDQTAIVRIRQNGTDDLAVSFYKVDDYTGAIGNLHPGDAGYAAAAANRAYQLSTGGTSIGGPGYGNFEQAALLNVDAGDLIAQTLSDRTTGHTYWSFAAGNEANVVHQWNYGLNVVGWEDMYGGGDYDFNDLVVGIDFTSASGSGWLV